ncbi:methyltransferase-like protein 24 [Arapaima gigas]
MGVMARERLRCGLAARGCLLIGALCLAVHIYLEPERRERGGGGRGSIGRTARGDAEATGDDPVSTCCPPLEPHRKTVRWHIDLQPWAGSLHSLEDEATRFLTYIKTPQVRCGPPVGGRPAEDQRGSRGPWRVCLDERYGLSRRIGKKRCRVYSLGLGMDSTGLELSLARAGCEVHRFDPSGPQAHLHDSAMWHHSLSVGWRDPNPAVPRARQRSTTKKMAAILHEFGHREIDVLKADMESAEWKILENLILENVLEHIGQLLLEIHLHWPGFEVGGDDAAVVRYWYSLLKELEKSHFRLFYSHQSGGRPHLFLRRNLFNTSSTYTLGWVNSRWRSH